MSQEQEPEISGMTLVIILKFFHYLALFLAGGLGIGAGIIQSAHKKAETPPAAPVQAALRTLAWLALVAIVILWISGIWLAYSLYGGMAVGWAFHMKLLGATGLLVAIAGLNFHLSSVVRSGAMPNARLMKIIPMVSRGSLVLVLVGIAITTTTG